MFPVRNCNRSTMQWSFPSRYYHKILAAGKPAYRDALCVGEIPIKSNTGQIIERYTRPFIRSEGFSFGLFQKKNWHGVLEAFLDSEYSTLCTRIF